MASNYWAKVYIEIIDDPKMATMPDRLWRRTIELILIAKKYNADGHIPSTRQLAWMLRMPIEELELDLQQIASVGIIQPEIDGWFVVNFKKRQSASTSTERSRQFRERQQQEQYYGNATEMQRNVPQRTETETETETESVAHSNFDTIKNWIEQTTGIPGDGKSAIDAIKELEKQHPTLSDIQEGVKWLDDQGKTIRYYSTLVGPVKTAIAKRLGVERKKNHNVPAAAGYTPG